MTTQKQLTDIKETAAFFMAADNYLIVTHKNPDGDTIGSAAALCSALRRAGKTAYLFPNPQVTEKYMPYVQVFLAPEGFCAETMVAVDIADKDMVPKGFSWDFDICVDHHPTNPFYAKQNCVDRSAAACGMIILELIESMSGTVTKEEADLLYIAVSTDTGCFRYSNADSRCFLSAAKLLEYGADNTQLNKKFFMEFSRARVMLESLIYSGMSFHNSGKTAVAMVTKEIMEKSGATQNDCDDLANLPGRIEGVAVGITIKETDDGKSKISVRTGENVSASDICVRFGGGGHIRASGCFIDAAPSEAQQQILAVVDEVLS